jgi:hypothetical protein
MGKVYTNSVIRQASEIPVEKRPHQERPRQKRDDPHETGYQKADCLICFFEFGDLPIYSHSDRCGNDHTNETVEIEKKIVEFFGWSSLRK